MVVHVVLLIHVHVAQVSPVRHVQPLSALNHVKTVAPAPLLTFALAHLVGLALTVQLRYVHQRVKTEAHVQRQKSVLVFLATQD